MQSSLSKSARAILALCVLGLAACAPEGDPVGVSAIPTDIGAVTVADRPEDRHADHELVECEASRARNPECEERCQLEIR